MSELEDYRRQIDEVDAQLVDLFRRRMDITRRVGEYKQARGVPVLDAAREREVLAKKAAMVDDPLLKADVATLFQTIMALSRRQQRRLVHEGAEDPGYAAYRDALSRAREQDTVNLATLENDKLTIEGRHDPCIVHRAVPVIEAAAALATCELLGI